MKYIFTENQFATLLALSGKKKIFMFPQSQKLQNSDIIHAVTDLYRMERVIWDQGKLILSDDIRDTIDIMEQASYVIKILFVGDGGSHHLIYPDRQGNIVIVEKQITFGHPIIKLWLTDMGYYLGELFKNDMLPEDLTADRKEAESLEKIAFENTMMEYDQKDILLAVRRVSAKNTAADHMIDVFCRDIFKWIRVYGESGGYYHLYSQEELGKLLLAEIKGAEL